jgi:hypothetical protein
MISARLVPAVAAALLVGGCAPPPLTPTPSPDRPPAGDRPVPPQRPVPAPPEPPSLGLFSRIKTPDGHEVVARYPAKGVQIFRCERNGQAYEWRFRQPEAELFDAQGQSVGRHGAHFSFEHRDGSRTLGTVVAHDKGGAEALPWLLFSAKSFGKGEFGGVTYVQRINTQGGMPPRSCDAGQANRLLRVDFSAEFVFYRARA